ncbi:hypothetical protein ACFGVR_01815 [Mucilaginibacter sp. AW1-3]
MNKIIGAVLITAGIILMLWMGFTYHQKDQATKAIQAFEDADKTPNWPLYTGGFFLAGGITIMVMSKKEDKLW